VERRARVLIFNLSWARWSVSSDAIDGGARGRVWLLFAAEQLDQDSRLAGAWPFRWKLGSWQCVAWGWLAEEARAVIVVVAAKKVKYFPMRYTKLR
jgi:hypothetical protein